MKQIKKVILPESKDPCLSCTHENGAERWVVLNQKRSEIELIDEHNDSVFLSESFFDQFKLQSIIEWLRFECSISVVLGNIRPEYPKPFLARI